MIRKHGPGHQPLKLVCTEFEISHHYSHNTNFNILYEFTVAVLSII